MTKPLASGASNQQVIYAEIMATSLNYDCEVSGDLEGINTKLNDRKHFDLRPDPQEEVDMVDKVINADYVRNG